MMLSISFSAIRCNLRVRNIHNLKNYKNVSVFISRTIFKSHKSFYNSGNAKQCVNNPTKQSVRLFSSEQLVEPKDPDVFGDISGDRYQRLELDDDEKEQEEFEENESRIPRYKKPSAGQYADMIKEHITKGDLQGALGVLNLIKSNRDKPNTYMFNLLIRAFGMQGDLYRAEKLFAQLKKRALKPNAATYTSMLNACATTVYHKSAMECLVKLREEFRQKDIVLNQTHYNALAKAYGMHNCLLEAFQVVDMMLDNKIQISDTTFNTLLCASISDRANGLRHALNVWHMMKRFKIKPNIMTYNLMLRAIRDTKLNDLNVNDILSEDNKETKILLTDDLKSDLLSSPPTVSSLMIKSLKPDAIKGKHKKNEESDSTENDFSTNPDEDDTVRVEYISSVGPNERFKIKLEQSKIVACSSAEPNKERNDHKIKSDSIEHSLSTELIELVKNDEKEEKIPLCTIHEKNKLILFGGFKGFLERMENDGITPDVKTLTFMMEVAPSSLSVENELIELAQSKKINLDIDFFNLLIKKRSFRKDYENAKIILHEIQKYNLMPNIMTWGVLALGCKTREDGLALLDCMRTTGHMMNTVIASSLLGNACLNKNFAYVNDIIDRMIKLKIRPGKKLYEILDKFQQTIKDIVTGKVKSKHTKNPRYRVRLAIFYRKYAKLQEQFERDDKTAKVEDTGRR